MNKHRNKKIQGLDSKREVRGFTLIEILIFTAIVSVFFVVAAAVSAFSLAIMKNNENKVYATHYAEEAIEWLRNEKETTGWITFSSRSNVTPGTSWCLNTLGWTSGNCSGAYSLGTGGKTFLRYVTLINSSGNISANVVVAWIDSGGSVHSVPVNTIFAQTE